MVEGYYNKIAPIYDSLFDRPYDRIEEGVVTNIIYPNLVWGEGVIDVGCGTGLLLDLISCDPASYVGIDPSKGMIKIFRGKYPYHKAVVGKFEDSEERLHNFSGSMIGLFGSPSYIKPCVFNEFFEKYVKRNKYFFMFYADNYTPITYLKTERKECEYYKEGEYESSDGISYRLFDYVVHTNMGINENI